MTAKIDLMEALKSSLAAAAPTPTPTLAERARAEYEQWERTREAQESEKAARHLAERKELLVKLLAGNLGAVPETLTVDADGQNLEAHVEGLTFALRPSPFDDERTRLHVSTECANGCGAPVWVTVESLWDLHAALSQPQRHFHRCIDEPESERPKVLTPQGKAEASIARLTEAADQVADAVNAVTRAEDDRALVKAAAIRRLVETGAATSVTGAEKIVEADASYAQHRATQRELEIEKQRAFAAYKAAELTAQLDVAIAAAALRGENNG